MRTFSGKSQNIDEGGILNSVQAGKNKIVDDFLHYVSGTLRSTDYTLNSENGEQSIDLTCDRPVIFANRVDLPVRVRTCDELTITDCGMNTFILPNQAHKLIIEKCSKLETLAAIGDIEIDELIITNCDKLKDISCLENATINHIKLVDCAITTLKPLKCAASSIVIKKCKDVKVYDLETKDTPNIKIENCKINKFITPIRANRITLDSVTRSSSLDVEIAQAVDVVITELVKPTKLNVSGKQVDTLVIKDCEALKELSLSIDCKTSLTLAELPEIEAMEILPIKGYCIVEHTKVMPKCECKKIIVRK